MLSATCESIAGLQYPLLASPKLDGIRAVVLNGRLVSRNLKAIRNAHTYDRFSHESIEGLDGELICGPHDAEVFRRTTSAVSSADGEPDVTFWVFDVYGLSCGFEKRMAYLRGLTLPKGVRVVPHVYINNARELEKYETEQLALGFEGVMLRSLEGPYKEGRSTSREGYLMKLKRFEDAEAEVIGFEERMHNGNPATLDALGHTERSSHKANMVGRGDLGALVVRGLNGPYAGQKFNIGTGFSDADRAWWWAGRDDKLGTVVKYKFFPTGSKEAPRFPTYLAIVPHGL